MEGGVYWRAVSIGGRCLLEGGVYWRAVSIGGRCLLEGGVYWRAVSIGGRCLLEGRCLFGGQRLLQELRLVNIVLIGDYIFEESDPVMEKLLPTFNLNNLVKTTRISLTWCLLIRTLGPHQGFLIGGGGGGGEQCEILNINE